MAELNFMNSESKALFGVFDGHGGREVAVYCGNHYADILSEKKQLIQTKGTEEWLRSSFLDVDVQVAAAPG